MNDNACGIALDSDVGVFLALLSSLRDDAGLVFDKVPIPEEFPGLDRGVEVLIVHETVEVALRPGGVADEFVPLRLIDRRAGTLLDIDKDLVFLVCQKFECAVGGDSSAWNGGGVALRGDLASGVVLAGKAEGALGVAAFDVGEGGAMLCEAVFQGLHGRVFRGVDLHLLGPRDGLDVAADGLPEGVHGGVGDAAVVVERLRGGVGTFRRAVAVELPTCPRRHAEALHILGIEMGGLRDGRLAAPAVLGHLALEVTLAAFDGDVADGAGVGQERVALGDGGGTDPRLLGVQRGARLAGLQAEGLVLAGEAILPARARVDAQGGAELEEAELAVLGVAPLPQRRAAVGQGAVARGGFLGQGLAAERGEGVGEGRDGCLGVGVPAVGLGEVAPQGEELTRGLFVARHGGLPERGVHRVLRLLQLPLGGHARLLAGIDFRAGLWDSSDFERTRVSVGGFASTGACWQFSRQSFFVAKLNVIGSVPVCVFLDGDVSDERFSLKRYVVCEVDEAEVRLFPLSRRVWDRVFQHLVKVLNDEELERAVPMRQDGFDGRL